MANTLTNLIPSLYAGLDKVSREYTGFIPSVYRDTEISRGALNQAITFPITPAGTTDDISPAMTVPEPGNKTIGNGSITITKSKFSEFGFVGEERLGLNSGPGYSVVQADLFAQAVRALCNEIEGDLLAAAVAGASRAWGAPNTPVFSSNTNDVSQLGKILTDNGAPPSERNLVVGTTAGASLRTLYGINADRDWSKVDFQQQGVLVTPHQMAIRETGQTALHTGGDADGATTNAAGYAVGATTITLASAGTGAILAGDIITFAGDSRQYVVVTGDANVSGGGTIVIQSPGLKQAIAGAETAITVVGSQTSPADTDYEVAGVAFNRNAIALAARAPALPEEGDAAADRMMIVDPRSGLPFEVSVYTGYRKVRYEVALAWGVSAIAPRHIALLVS